MKRLNFFLYTTKEKETLNSYINSKWWSWIPSLFPPPTRRWRTVDFLLEEVIAQLLRNPLEPFAALVGTGRCNLSNIPFLLCAQILWDPLLATLLLQWDPTPPQKNYLMLPLLFSYQKSTYSVLARCVFPELNTVAKQHLTQFRS